VSATAAGDSSAAGGVSRQKGAPRSLLQAPPAGCSVCAHCQHVSLTEPRYSAMLPVPIVRLLRFIAGSPGACSGARDVEQPAATGNSTAAGKRKAPGNGAQGAGRLTRARSCRDP
jgi:hypothetical protein